MISILFSDHQILHISRTLSKLVSKNRVPISNNQANFRFCYSRIGLKKKILLQNRREIFPCSCRRPFSFICNAFLLTNYHFFKSIFLLYHFMIMAQYLCKQSHSRFRLKKFEPELGSFLTLFFRII